MIKPYKTFIMLHTTLVLLMTAPVFAAQTESPIPFGGYHENGKCGCYGAKVAIKSIGEARKIIEKFLIGHDLRIGSMEERPNFFRAKLVDRNGAVQDVVIVNKANGRVRSVY